MLNRIANCLVTASALLVLSACGGSNPAGTQETESSSGGSSLDNLAEDYPRNKVLILVRENPITAETCGLFKRVSGWHEKAICVNNVTDWKVLCAAAESVLDDLLEIPAKAAGMSGESNNSEDALLHVARNGGASFVATKWEEDQSQDWGRCKLQVEYSGMYEGSTISESLWGNVSGIVIRDDGSVLLTH
jgi:hypothetical protein